MTSDHKITSRFFKRIESNTLSQVELKFYRRLLHVKRNTSIIGIRGKLGRHPITLTALLNSIKYLNKLQSTKQDKLVNLALQESKTSQHKASWYNKVEKLMTDLKLNPDTVHHTKQSSKIFAKSIERKLKNAYEQYWHTQLYSNNSISADKGGNKLRTYRLVKSNFGLEEYLKCVDNLQHKKSMAQLQLSSRPLNIESYRGTLGDPNN